MKISTKGRYALRVMIDLARYGTKEYLPLRTLSMRQGISEKYLENILGALVRAGILEGARGKGGGYKMKADPTVCTVWDVLVCEEASLAPVQCLDSEPVDCDRVNYCPTLPFWRDLGNLVKNYMQSVTLEQLCKNAPKFFSTYMPPQCDDAWAPEL